MFSDRYNWFTPIRYLLSYRSPLSCNHTAKRYTKDHEYVILDDATNIGTVGITDYAQQALGDVVFVELPGVDTEVAAEGTPLGIVLNTVIRLADWHSTST